MKKTYSQMLLSMVVTPALLVAGSLHANASGLDVLGGLDIQGQVQILAAGAKTPLKLSNTTYAYVAGDAIKNGDDTTSVLKLDGVGRIGLASDAAASVTRAGHSIIVDLTAGTLAYALEPGADISIQVAGMTLRPEQAPIRLVSNDHDARTTGWVDLGADGKVHVSARTGKLTVSQGGILRSVSAGEESVFTFEHGQLILAQATGANGSSTNSAGTAGLTGKELAALLLAGGGTITYFVSKNSGSGGGLASP